MGQNCCVETTEGKVRDDERPGYEVVQPADEVTITDEAEQLPGDKCAADQASSRVVQEAAMQGTKVELPEAAPAPPAADIDDAAEEFKKQAAAEEAKKQAAAEAAKEQAAIEARRQEWEELMAQTRQKLMSDGQTGAANRYGENSTLPEFDDSRHVPVLALINPASGAKAGKDILGVAMRSPAYKSSFFNIIEVIKGQKRGGALDVFRVELLKAVAKAKSQGIRPRVITAGGDGTASFGMFVIFKALEAKAGREEDGLVDTGNGFIWTDEEFEASFPALAQMPLGSANDCGNILGWGQTYPGSGFLPGKENAARKLRDWLSAAISKESSVVNFDVWGMMPAPGLDATDFKIAELTGKPGWSPRVRRDGKVQLDFKTTGNPVPFFVCLYFSIGFFGYVVARFQLNRHSKPVYNTLEYLRQGAMVIAHDRIPPQLKKDLDGVTVDAGGERWLPPRTTAKASSYREAGFYNVNFQAKRFHGKDRAPLCSRLCCSKREPVKFNDGLLDLQRQKLGTLVKNPGFTMQVDKRKDFLAKFDGGEGKGIFFQYDGEARFAFRPDGGPFTLYIRKVLNLPVVIGPKMKEKFTGLKKGDRQNAKFHFHGDTQEEREQVKRRLFKNLSGSLEEEMCATIDELKQANLIAGDAVEFSNKV